MSRTPGGLHPYSSVKSCALHCCTAFILTQFTVAFILQELSIAIVLQYFR